MHKILHCLLIFILLYIGCSIDPLAGGSTDTELGGSVVGVIYGKSGEPASNTQVTLIPGNYNPIAQGSLPDSLKDTTDLLGNYSIKIRETGTFNVEAVHITHRERMLVTNIHVQNDTTVVPPMTLKDPGMVKLYLPDTFDTADGYIYIEGTTLYRRLSESSGGNGVSAAIDSAFATTIPSIYFNRVNNPITSLRLTDPIDVFSNDTTVIDPFVSWVQYTTDNSDLPGNEVVDIFMCSSSFLWMPDPVSIWFSCYTKGIGVFNKSTWEVYDLSSSAIPTENVLQVLRIDNSNKIWVASLRGLMQFDGSDWQVWDSTTTVMPTNFLFHIEPDSKGDIWAGMHYGIGFFDTGTEQWTIYDTVTTGLDRHWVEGIAVDKNDNPWFATSTGVGHFNGSSWTVYTTSSGLLENNTVSVAVDSMDNLWFGHQDGLSQYDGSTWTTFTTADSKILTGNTQAIVPDGNNNIWFGTQSGLTRYDGATWKDYDGERYSVLQDKSIRSIAFDDEGTMWMGTDSSGVIKLIIK